MDSAVLPPPFAGRRCSGWQTTEPDAPLSADQRNSELNSELIRTYLRSVVVVYAVMDTQGRLAAAGCQTESRGPAQSSDPCRLIKMGISARPLNGEAVPLKVLIGIPLLPYD